LFEIDPAIVVAGLGVGFLVGMTGMGGGALMTPILVLGFGVPPLSAVSSDVVASMFMKPVGGGVHLRRGSVHRGIVLWLALGSVPAAFGGVWLLRSVGGDSLEPVLRFALGLALLAAASAIVIRTYLGRRRTAVGEDEAHVEVRPLPTLLIGLAGGLIVSATSVGSGSLMIVALLFLYPTLRPAALVGTDLVQAVPLVAAAALGHLMFGDVQAAVTGSVILGAVPGAYLGANASVRAPDRLVRSAVTVVLAASGLKLVGAF
jgi:uncharacterized membrane protein YfcA